MANVFHLNGGKGKRNGKTGLGGGRNCVPCVDNAFLGHARAYAHCAVFQKSTDCFKQESVNFNVFNYGEFYNLNLCAFKQSCDFNLFLEAERRVLGLRFKDNGAVCNNDVSHFAHPFV